MSMRVKRLILLSLFLLGVEMVFAARRADAQDLGHKLPGLIGLDAGRILNPDLHRSIAWSGTRPTRYAIGGATGFLSATWACWEFQTPRVFRHCSARLEIVYRNRRRAADPLEARRSRSPGASVDRFGLGDIYIQPARVGWRRDRVDLVGSYGLYIPTGTSPLAGGSGLSAGHVTNEFSAGGTIFADRNRTAFLTALTSYDLNLRKRGVDITRGDTLQVQGGAGASLLNGVVEAGWHSTASGRFAMTGAPIFPACSAGPEIASMDLDPMSRCSFKAFNRKSGFAMNGTWGSDRVRKAVCSSSDSTSPCIARSGHHRDGDKWSNRVPVRAEPSAGRRLGLASRPAKGYCCFHPRWPRCDSRFWRCFF